MRVKWQGPYTIITLLGGYGGKEEDVALECQIAFLMHQTDWHLLLCAEETLISTVGGCFAVPPEAVRVKRT